MAGLLLLAVLAPAQAVVELVGVGASFPAEVYGSWRPTYEYSRKQWVNLKMTYNDQSSRTGKLAIMEGSVQYGATDAELTAVEKMQAPDLQMFPVVAGAVAVAYNLPAVPSLVLSRSALVGIFNGSITWWNDTRLTQLNPQVPFPQKRIIVVARADYAGTTEIFTGALSAFDSNWAATVGTFAEGLEPNGVNHSRWNMSVVKQYGLTSRGMVGMLLSLHCAIGYLSIAEVIRANITYASLISQTGNAVDVNTTATRLVVEEACPFLDQNLTRSLVDSPLPSAYPILGFSYFVVRRSGMRNCDSAVELLRYVLWLYDDPLAYDDANSVGMTQLPPCVKLAVIQMALKSLLCEEVNNVWNLAEEQVAREEIEAVTWKAAVWVLVPLAVSVLVALFGYATHQHMALNRAILADDWRIDEHALDFSNSASTVSMRSMRNECTAVWHHRRVHLKEVEGISLDAWKSMAKTLLQFKYRVIDANVMRFYGVVFIREVSHMVTEHSDKGTLTNVLHSCRYTIESSLQWAMACDISSGMEYLHRSQIIHGRLSTDHCLLDNHWTIKLTNWEDHLLRQMGHGKDLRQEEQVWVAPELLRKPAAQASEPCDIYSFALILVAIFTRKNPFGESDPKDVIHQLKVKDLRPKVKGLVPDRVWCIAKKCWHPKAELRPDASSVLSSVHKAHASKKTVLEHMLGTLSSYAEQLEERVAQRNSELSVVNASLENLLHQMLPPCVADQLRRGRQVQPASFNMVTVCFLHLVDLSDACNDAKPKEVVAFLNDVYAEFDHMVDTYNIYKVETVADCYMCLSGLEESDTTHACRMADMGLALMKTSAKRSFQGKVLHLQAGLHSGPVVAGVIGMRRPKYCIFGDTVNTASRMESTSLPGQMQISFATQQLLVDGYRLSERGNLFIKGKGIMTTYFLEGKTEQ